MTKRPLSIAEFTSMGMWDDWIKKGEILEKGVFFHDFRAYSGSDYDVWRDLRLYLAKNIKVLNTQEYQTMLQENPRARKFQQLAYFGDYLNFGKDPKFVALHARLRKLLSNPRSTILKTDIDDINKQGSSNRSDYTPHKIVNILPGFYHDVWHFELIVSIY